MNGGLAIINSKKKPSEPAEKSKRYELLTIGCVQKICLQPKFFDC